MAITADRIEPVAAKPSRAELAARVAALTAELREAREQQNAAAEMLEVINASPGDLAPVFDAMLDRALRLCEAALGVLFRYDGTTMRLAAQRGATAAALDAFAAWVPEPDSGMGQIVQGAAVLHIADVTDSDAYRAGVESRVKLVEATGARTALWVALRRDGVLLGVIVVYRREIRPFAERQIALLQNFAAQAVIAIENARLLTETREALEKQTATAEILRVISSSPTDVQPTFDAIAASAVRICGAANGGIFRFDGSLIHFVAHHGWTPEELEGVARHFPLSPGRQSVTARAILTREVAHVADIAADPEFALTAIAQSGIRATLSVPMLKDGTPLGAVTVTRYVAEPFTEGQIDLLKTFADQAVIAIENVRLFNELNDRTADLQESLEYQTAIGDVLKVISRSTFDLQPVLDTLVATAARLCEADAAGLATREGVGYRYVAAFSPVDEFYALLRQNPLAPSRATLAGRTALEGRVVHIRDLAADPEYALPETISVGKYHTGLGVPLLREGAVIGTISLVRQRVEPFTERQIELIRTFATQAVIAMDNARLLNELRRRQGELRVTFDNMADGVAMFDGELRLAAWNRNFQEMLDLPDDYLGERPSYADYVRYLTEHGEFGTADPEAELARLRREVEAHSRYERVRPDGTVMEVRHNPMPDGGFVLMYGDITDRKRAEEAVRAARDAAEAALGELRVAQASLIHAEKMASLGQLTAGIAHEIKNPLNFVNNFAALSVELLDELRAAAAPAIDTLGAEVRAEIDETIDMLTGNLDKIAEHGRRADGIVKSMLAHSRGTSGERQPTDLNALVEEALNLAYHGARAQDPNFNIALERDFAAGIVAVELVPQDVTRVFLNLVGNGFHAARMRQKEGADPAFRPVLKVTTRDLGDAVEVRVRDNGIGIRPEHRGKLFQPFFTTKPTGEGTGLGLSISYDIVTQQHGGTITVDSRLGGFTEFTIRLPRSAAAIAHGGVR